LTKGTGDMTDILRIGTRASRLAMVQAQAVSAMITERYPRCTVEIVPVSTRGDREQSVPLHALGVQGVFVKEIEEALFAGAIDLAVHSMKDLPFALPDGLLITVVLPREDARDALISRGGKTLRSLPRGARIGTGAVRRTMQLHAMGRGFFVEPLRGNLDTRLRKLSTQDLDGVIVAAAGMKRMGWQDRITEYIDEDLMLPMAGQGAIAIETRMDDGGVRDMLACLNHEATFQEVTAERSLLKGLGGGCHVPVAARAVVRENGIEIRGMVGRIDGSDLIREEIRGSATDGEALGLRLAQRILHAGGDSILESMKTGNDPG